MRKYRISIPEDMIIDYCRRNTDLTKDEILTVCGCFRDNHNVYPNELWDAARMLQQDDKLNTAIVEFYSPVNGDEIAGHIADELLEAAARVTLEF